LIGETVRVQDVKVVGDRVRAKLEKGGWISLRSVDNSKVWAVEQPEEHSKVSKVVMNTNPLVDTRKVVMEFDLLPDTPILELMEKWVSDHWKMKTSELQK